MARKNKDVWKKTTPTESDLSIGGMCQVRSPDGELTMCHMRTVDSLLKPGFTWKTNCVKQFDKVEIARLIRLLPTLEGCVSKIAVLRILGE